MVRPLRKLAIAAISFSLSVFASCYLLKLSLLPWLAGIFCLIGLCLILIRQRWLLGFGICAFGLACGFVCFFLRAQLVVLPAVSLDGTTMEIRGEVCAYPQIREDYARVELKMKGEGLPKGRLLLYADGETLSSFEPGDTICCTASLKRADERYGERYDSYLSRGIVLTGNAKSAPERIVCGSRLRYVPLRFQRLLAERIELLFPEDSAAFMKSLMLGDKQDLYRNEELYLAMNRAGFLHIVAVSGMHIAYLVGLIQLLLGKSRRSSLLCLGLVWLFVLITGSPASAVRAAVMQSFLLIAPLVNRENDPATSLSAALALILLWNPYAAGSVGLQLSFSAMAGILCFAEPLRRSISRLLPERLALCLRGLIGTAAGSLAVLAFSVPLTVWHFHAVSLLSPLTNILGLWAVSLCFCGGYLSCLISFIWTPLGTGLAWLVSWLARYLFLVARSVSSLSFAMLYLRTLPSYLWIVLVYALVVLFSFSRLRGWIRLAAPILLAALMLALMLFSVRERYRSQSGTIAIVDVGQGQSIVLMSGDQTLVVDCGSIFSLDNAGEQTGAYLSSCGRKQVDALLLTHLHADHVNGASMLMRMLPVKELILPAGVEDEDGLLDELLDTARDCGTEVLRLERDTELVYGGIRARLFMPMEQGSANERCMTGVFSLGSYDMLVTGDSSKTTEKLLLQKDGVRDLELLIVGHHGSRYASSGELLGAIGARTAVISVGYNTFGHPTHEVLERLVAYGYKVFRTDLNGTIEIYPGKSYG